MSLIHEVRNLSLSRQAGQNMIVGTDKDGKVFSLVLTDEQVLMICKQAFNLVCEAKQGHCL
jgi:hypothetical protein